MTLLLNLTSDQEMRLRTLASTQGQALDLYAHELFDDALSSKAEASRPFYETATTEEWLTAFQEWIDSHDAQVPVLLNDSREIIYED